MIMKNKKLCISILCLINLISSNVNGRDEKKSSLQIYDELVKQEIVIDSLVNIINNIQNNDNDKVYLEYLLMEQYGEHGIWDKLDSTYNIVHSKLTKQNKQLKAFEATQIYCTYLNSNQEYNKSLPILNRLIEEITPLTQKGKNKLKFLDIQSTCMYELAYNLMQNSKTEESLNAINKAIDNYILLNDSAMLIEAYNISGILENRLSRSEKAIENYKKALEISRGNNDDISTSIIYCNIATLYNKLENFPQAIYASRKAIMYYPDKNENTLQNRIKLIELLNSLGVILDNAGETKNAIDTMQVANRLLDTHTPQGLKLLVYTNLAKAYNSYNMLDSSFTYFQKAIACKPYSKHGPNIANLDYLYGIYLTNNTHHYTEAQKYLNDAINFYKNNPNEVYTKSLLSLAELEAHKFHNYSKAYQIIKEAFQVEKNLQYDIFQKKLASFEVEYKTKEKEIEIIKLAAKNKEEKDAYQLRLLIVLSALIVISMFIVILIFYMRRKRAIYELKEASLKNEIQRKDFETKTLLQDVDKKLADKYIDGLEDSNKHMAKELHDGICNKLLTLEMSLKDTVANNVINELVKLRNEVRDLSHQLASPEFKSITLLQSIKLYIDKLHNSKLLNVTYYEDPTLENTTISSSNQHEVYRIFQEVISNIIKHASAENVFINISQQNGLIELIIEDDGVGFEVNTDQNGMGIRTMHERIKSINGNLNIMSSPGQGTIIHISFNIL